VGDGLPDIEVGRVADRVTRSIDLKGIPSFRRASFSIPGFRVSPYQ
jgi:hypothetical protein